MRVAYVLMQFPSPTETFAATDIRALGRAGARVSVHAFRPRRRDFARLAAEREVADLPISHATPAGVLAGLWLGVRCPAVAWHLLRFVVRAGGGRPTHLLKGMALAPRALGIFAEIAAARPEVVHLFWGHYPVLVGALVRRFLPESVLSVFLGAYDLEAGYGGTRILAPHADVVWTHARANVADIVAVGVPESAVQVSYRGIALPEEPDVGAKVSRRIATAGRLIPGKRTDRALALFAAVRERWPDASLAVMGEGPERARLEALASTLGVADGVRFLGHVSHEAVFAGLAQAEVFVTMSQNPSERLPNAVKEAMACGCVCLAAPSKGIDELIEEGRTGFVVDPDDLDLALERVARVFGSADAARSMGAAARRMLAERFDVDRLMAGYLARWRAAHAARGAAESARPVADRAMRERAAGSG